MEVPALPAVFARLFWQWGKIILLTAFLGGTGLVLFLAWRLEWLVMLVPALLLGAVAAIPALSAFPRSLYLVLAGFVAIAAPEDGIQVREVIFGLLYFGLLGYWLVSRFVFYRDDVLRTRTDWSLALFLFVAAGSAGMTVLFEGTPSDFVGEAISLSFLALYFPVKEAVRRDPKALRRLLLVVAWFGLFAALRNLFVLRKALSEAIYLWQVTKGRIALNEILLMMPALVALTLVIYIRPLRYRLILLAAFLVFTAGLVVTQSRAYWVSFLLGALVLFVMVDWRRRGRILALLFTGLTGVLVIGLLLYPEFLRLLLAGVVDRFVSLATASQADISLLNRYNETAAVWELVQRNPILGYGMGTPYEYYAFIYKSTLHWSFVHNGYLALWYKFGFPGLALMLFFWGSSIINGFALFRRPGLDRSLRLGALAAAVCLSAETVVANTSNPFIIEDGSLMFALFAGVIAGCRERADTEPAGSPGHAGGAIPL